MISFGMVRKKQKEKKENGWVEHRGICVVASCVSMDHLLIWHKLKVMSYANLKTCGIV